MCIQFMTLDSDIHSVSDTFYDICPVESPLKRAAIRRMNEFRGTRPYLAWVTSVNQERMAA